MCSLYLYLSHLSEKDTQQKAEPGTAELYVSVLRGIKA